MTIKISFKKDNYCWIHSRFKSWILLPVWLSCAFLQLSVYRNSRSAQQNSRGRWWSLFSRPYGQCLRTGRPVDNVFYNVNNTSNKSNMVIHFNSRYRSGLAYFCTKQEWAQLQFLFHFATNISKRRMDWSAFYVLTLQPKYPMTSVSNKQIIIIILIVKPSLNQYLNFCQLVL